MSDNKAIDHTCLHCALKAFTNEWHQKYATELSHTESNELVCGAFAKVLGDFIGQLVLEMDSETWAKVGFEVVEAVRKRAMDMAGTLRLANAIAKDVLAELPVVEDEPVPAPTHQGVRTVQ
jgi:hypothetical protein